MTEEKSEMSILAEKEQVIISRLQEVSGLINDLVSSAHKWENGQPPVNIVMSHQYAQKAAAEACHWTYDIRLAISNFIEGEAKKEVIRNAASGNAPKGKIINMFGEDPKQGEE